MKNVTVSVEFVSTNRHQLTIAKSHMIFLYHERTQGLIPMDFTIDEMCGSWIEAILVNFDAIPDPFRATLYEQCVRALDGNIERLLADPNQLAVVTICEGVSFRLFLLEGLPTTSNQAS